jgi:hypothetical protein
MKPFSIFPALILSMAFVFGLAGCEKDNIDSQPDQNTKKDFILAGERSSQTRYYDLNPDWDRYAFGLAGDSINLDINADSVPDISIKYSTLAIASTYTTQVTAKSLHGTKYTAVPVKPGDAIDAHSSWTTSTTLLGFAKIDFATSDTTFTGDWISTEDQFIGVSLVKNNRNFYGWIRISVFVHPVTIYLEEIRVKDFCCQRL